MGRDLNGQQFMINKCENCDIWILDNTATVSIDKTTNCRIYLGPCESSLFFRNCSDLKVIAACQQFRTRDCTNCDFMLFCMTAPIIEASDSMRFTCFNFSYFSLTKQMDSAGLDPFTNCWYDIYDFNKGSKPHWSFITPPPLSGNEWMVPPTSDEEGKITAEFDQSIPCPIPFSVGEAEKGRDSTCCAIVPRSMAESLLTISAKLEKLEDVDLLRCRGTHLDKNRVKEVPQGDSSLIGDVVCMEYRGTPKGCETAIAMLADLESPSIILASDVAREACRLFFNVWVESKGSAVTVM
uniref:C-CAP/cofactor C-like domain-containing protein n=1 Tax=Palpitomonas bilix TaxID=652834 RepID=A0A7S3GM99_9EUKA|mmetsp:Transcript_9348/g.25394  ORF Transcript_9348/g.25394 Transcript_9348/m.25394 type:complete len:296 (+) Transcript_9348:180-1067(+)